MCKYELPILQGFRKLSSKDRQTYRQTESAEIIYNAASRVVRNSKCTATDTVSTVYCKYSLCTVITGDDGQRGVQGRTAAR